MTKMSVTEFRDDPDRALAMIEAGIAVELTRDGAVVVNMTPVLPVPTQADREAALNRLLRTIDEGGLPFGRKFTYEERTR